MQIIMFSSEIAPFSKTGGLGDVVGALPSALHDLGHELAVVTPFYREVAENAESNGIELKPINEGSFNVPIGDDERTACLMEAYLPHSDVKVYFIGNDYYFDRPGLYIDPQTGQDHQDNSERFIFFCRAAMETCIKLNLQPDIFHAHDWQTGLIPVYLNHMYRSEFPRAVSVYTIHNVAYQGVFWHWDMAMTGLPWELFNWRQLEFYGDLCLLKGGTVNANGITTVSKHYAREIQSEDFGMRLEGVFQERNNVLKGIVNGVDYSVWNPETDTLLPANFSPKDLSGKSKCKSELQKEFNLPVEKDTPLIGMIGRLVHQKGYDLIIKEMERIAELDVQLVLLGKGDRRLHDMLKSAAAAYPDKFSVSLGFDERLAHLIEAGSDMYLMPSRFEPCGLNQLYSMKYATIPLASATGGLVDTVIDYVQNPSDATGFLFRPDDPADMADTLQMASDTFKNQSDEWDKLISNAMAADWSWKRSALEYVDFYTSLQIGN